MKILLRPVERNDYRSDTIRGSRPL